MNAKIFVPKLKITTDRFLEAIEFFTPFGDEFLVTQSQSSAEIVLVQGQKDMFEFYDPDKLFCVIQIESESPEQRALTNVCVLNSVELFGEMGVEKIITSLKRHRVGKGQDPDQ